MAFATVILLAHLIALSVVKFFFIVDLLEAKKDVSLEVKAQKSNQFLKPALMGTYQKILQWSDGNHFLGLETVTGTDNRTLCLKINDFPYYDQS